MIETVGAEAWVDRVAQVELYRRDEFAPDPGSVPLGDQMRFERALHADASIVVPPQGGQTQPAVGDYGIVTPEMMAPQTSAPAGNTLGDRLLEGLENLRTRFNEGVDRVADMIGSQEEISPADMLEAQFEITQLSLSMSLVTNEVSAINQKIDTLLKSQ